MITFDPDIKSYRLTVEEPIAQRLMLTDRDNHSMVITHKDKALLKDLEAEIMKRFELREKDYKRRNIEGRWWDWLSLPVLFCLTVGANYAATKFHFRTVSLIFWIGLIGASGYAIISFALGHHKRAEPETMLMEDMELRQWIHTNCAGS